MSELWDSRACRNIVWARLRILNSLSSGERGRVVSFCVAYMVVQQLWCCCAVHKPSRPARGRRDFRLLMHITSWHIIYLHIYNALHPNKGSHIIYTSGIAISCAQCCPPPLHSPPTLPRSLNVMKLQSIMNAPNDTQRQSILQHAP
jgi:hypothetical protein